MRLAPMRLIFSYLGVDPLMGFCIAFDIMAAVTTENINQIMQKRYQKFFNDMQNGIAHMPTSVTI